MNNKYTIKYLPQVDFTTTWQEMKNFTEQRDENTLDQFWVLEHNPVFTLGQAGLESHILYREHQIPIIKTDRGGQVTYHGPGQIVIYTLIDIKRLNISIRCLVEKLENGIISYLKSKNINANGDRNAPGVYVNNKKIASLGLKVRKGFTYHGISFNYNLDITPFNYINVCGYKGLQVITLAELIETANIQKAKEELVHAIIDNIYSTTINSCKQ